MTSAEFIHIAGKRVGASEPCYVIAEIGINHNGDRELGAKTIAAAAAAGVDAVKFQNYRTDDFVSDRSLTHRYRTNGVEIEEPQYDLFKRCELSPDDLRVYRDAAHKAGVDFISTPTSVEGVADLVAIGAAAIKNGSDYLGHLPLIAAMAASDLPTILSIGMAVESEIEAAVAGFRDSGGRYLALLHCVSIYPAPLAELNLRKITTLAERFDCPVGYSDHAVGTFAASIAVGLGASIVEKHFTLDRSLPGPDHAMSSDAREMTDLVRTIRDLEAALGAGALTPSIGETATRLQYRLSCVAAHDLHPGEIIAEHDVAFRRPGNGLAPAKISIIVGKRLKSAAARGHVFQPSDFH